MTIRFDIPGPLEETLRSNGGDPNALAKEALLIDMYRRDMLSHGQLAEALGISRYETDAVLTRHGVVEDLMTREELDQQLTDLRKLIG